MPRQTEPPLGLIGIGLIGTVIAERLIAAGIRIVGWDLAADRRAALGQLHGTVAGSPEEVFEGCARVILSLPSHETVAEVLAQCEANLRAGQLIIDTSTGDPAAARARAAELFRRGIGYLDATISGSSAQLRQREAIFLVGAEPGDFAACRDLFEHLAVKSYHTGPPGTGTQMKLVSNLVLGLNRAALAEGLCFARALGLDLEQTLFLLRESAAYSRIMDTKGQKMIRGDFSPQARLSQHLKDVELITSAGDTAGAPLPLTDVHRDLLKRAQALGLGELDNSAILAAISSLETPSAMSPRQSQG